MSLFTPAFLISFIALLVVISANNPTDVPSQVLLLCVLSAMAVLYLQLSIYLQLSLFMKLLLLFSIYRSFSRTAPSIRCVITIFIAGNSKQLLDAVVGAAAISRAGILGVPATCVLGEILGWLPFASWPKDRKDWAGAGCTAVAAGLCMWCLWVGAGNPSSRMSGSYWETAH